MKNVSMTFVLAGLVTVAPVARARAQETSVQTETSSPVAGHLELGTRITHFVLVDEDDSNGFLGSIDHLGDEQDYIPYKVYADWLFCPYGGIELTWDHVGAIAKTSASDNHTDGKFVLDGPILTAFGRYPNASMFQPYAGLGAAFYMTDFEAEDWWAKGYSSPDDYASLGSPSEDRNGKSRSIQTDDTVGFVATAGTDIKITKNWSADLYFRYTAVDVDAHFTLLTNGKVTEDKGTYTIPFDNYTFGAGAKYVF